MEPDVTLLGALKPGDPAILQNGSSLFQCEILTVEKTTLTVTGSQLHFDRTTGFGIRQNGEPALRRFRIYPPTPEVEAWVEHEELALCVQRTMLEKYAQVRFLSDEKLHDLLHILEGVDETYPVMLCLNAQYREAEAFNATLSIPVAWRSGMKDVLSGLSAATVTHVLLLADLHDGKLHRVNGDLLCTSASGSNGKQWSAQRDSAHVDGDGALYAAKVTCKACLRIAMRWRRQ